MKRLGSIIVLSLLPTFPAPAADVPTIDAKEHVLDNGFKIVLIPRPMGGMVVARMFHGEGSAHDPPGLVGMAHFFEHLLFEGTPRLGTTDWEAERPILERLRELEREIEAEKDRLALEQRHRNADELDADEIPPIDYPRESTGRLGQLEARHRTLLEERRQYNRPLEINNSYYYWGDVLAYASTSVDYTQYWSFLPARHLETFFWIEADKYEPTFRNFYAARDAVQEQWLRSSLNPERVFSQRMQAMLFTGPWARRAAGGFGLEQATPLDAIRFKELYLTPNNSHAVLVGDFDPEDAIRLSETYFGRLPRGAAPPRVRAFELPPPGQRRLVVEGPGRPRVEIRFPIPAGASRFNPTFDLIAELLNGPAGRLATKLGPELVTRGEASRTTTRHYAYFSVTAQPRNNQAIEAVEAGLYDVLDELMGSPASAEELDDARARAEIAFTRLLADPHRLSRELGAQETLSTWRDVLARPEKWASVTEEQMMETAKATFPAFRRTTGIYRSTGGER